MIRLTQLKLPVRHSGRDLERAIAKKAGGKKPACWRVIKRSLDARKKPDLYYIYTIEASFSDEKTERRILGSKKSGWVKADRAEYRFPYSAGSLKIAKDRRPVVVGAGPAGLFAGLVLARAGFMPVIFERGDSVDRRQSLVDAFWEKGILDPESNVVFGEGGAGTFSDGKLNTLVKDRYGRNHFVLEEFVRHGGPEEILYEAKPHIGTDILKQVVSSIRREIEDLGGEFHFRTKVLRLITVKDIASEHIIGLHLIKDGREEEWPCEHVILATGHSARDTFAMLEDMRVPMSAKAFAIGVRVEHPAMMINESQYGKGYPDILPAAAYKLTHQCKNGRGVYSFCMCPGGYVVNSSSEEGMLCVNGMSYHGRDGENSNSAIITTVTPGDYPGSGPLAGLEFQRKYERLAYRSGKGRIPLQLLADFREDRITSGLGAIRPATKGGWSFANLRECLPDYVCESLLEGMTAFGRQIRGYDREDTILLGVESRTSSPVRIERGEDFQSRVKGLFPCGEGAGYAGGITSAAMDGIKVAEAAAKFLLKKE